MTQYSKRAAGIMAILADRPVAYHPRLAKVIGVKETVFVCQLLYWDGRGARNDGYIWKIQTEIEEETGLSRYEQETVRKNLKKRKILKEKLRGVPAKLHYKLNFDALAQAIEEAYPPDQDVEIPESSLQKPSNLDCDNSANKSAENPQTITEITPEITPKNTPENKPAPEATPIPEKDDIPLPEIEEPWKGPAPPAVKVYRARVHFNARKTLWRRIHETVGDQLDDLEFWDSVIAEYDALGWNPKNVSGMLEWFERRELPKVATSRHQKGGSGNLAQIDAYRAARIQYAVIEGEVL